MNARTPGFPFLHRDIVAGTTVLPPTVSPYQGYAAFGRNLGSDAGRLAGYGVTPGTTTTRLRDAPSPGDGAAATLPLDVRGEASATAAGSAAVRTPPAARPSNPDDIEVFGSFHLGDVEFALPIAALQEVVNYPARVTPVPLSPPFLLGLFNLRGTLIPIVDLKPLLAIASAAPTTVAPVTEKIAIVDVDGVRVGLLFDTTSEILRVRASQRTGFEYDPSHTAPQVVCGAIKLDGGDRILQILAPAALVHIENMPQLLARQALTAPQRRQQRQRLQCVSFTVEHSRLALPMSAIREIIRIPELQSSALASVFCVGMLNLRGTVVPVVDFAHFLGLHASRPEPGIAGTASDPRRILIVKQEDVHFGLLVDAVDNIVTYYADEVLAMPSFSASHAQLFSGCIAREPADDIVLLNADELFTHSQVLELTRGHRDLYREADSAQRAKAGDAAWRGNGAKSARGTRHAYVSFRLQHMLAVRLDQLREIIHDSPDVIPAPGAPAFVRGMLNLRRELVTIVDLRTLYGMPPQDEAQTRKILVIEHGKDKFGLLVDAIENIVTLDEADKLPVPAMLLGRATHEMRNDMREAVELPATDGAARTAMLLDLQPLKLRLETALAQ
ncbi:chemotaxis protein CheW [Pandoraea fibrosis]|uniref:Chemotaxis protein CheW n=1 Tax=Pandoraea fibrosis TaxID=1891094 RepID=A0ABX6HN39_9BURK|nr:chemotaxis protein CheW [Pandoraea fibrosis]QHE94213.1 chemotaxis protein CheW [Pandoraea fibrosis]QHF12223.1 chemotaxis protein CheW [Pandoraea fibrosis]